jgi:hypothetical protein
MLLPLLTSALAVVGVASVLGACVHAYRRRSDRDARVRLWTPSGLSVAVTTTLADYAVLPHRATTTHLLAAGQVAVAVASAMQYRAEGLTVHLVLASVLTATTTALVAYDAMAPVAVPRSSLR